MSQFGLSDKTLAVIHRIFEQEPGIQKAILYGSRAKGTYKNGSDIDLTLVGSTLTEAVRAKVAAALDESSIPYQVDLSILDQIANENLVAHIQRVGLVFYERRGDA